MKFTYAAYQGLLQLLQEQGYKIVGYNEWESEERCAILRHDIDNDLGKALKMAELEQQMGIKSTYFVLLSSDFYNVFSKESAKKLAAVRACGHDIGLHFDEARYPECSTNKLCQYILREAELLQAALGIPIKTVSMHRPSKKTLEANLQIPGMINSYSQIFFHEFKYLSDSRRNWREPILEIIRNRGGG